MSFTCISNLLKFSPWKIELWDCIATLSHLFLLTFNQSDAKLTNDKHLST